MNTNTVLSDLELETVAAGLHKGKKKEAPAEPTCDAPPACPTC